MVKNQGATTESETVEANETIYNDEGTVVGVVTELTESGFEVETTEGVTTEDDTFDVEEEQPGGEFGEGYIMWRCEECGEMGELEDGLPDSCPSCDAPKEALSKVRED
ncbi:hypothetical protein KTS45_17735 [Halomicroarcula limicola]|uniref:DUF7130 domain-containing protein n=1 Tax=Haloarcula limicola TaxID=1429915 RepID=A0A8J7YD37_9EURY|nr:hypothetical protein [Halomicroarcula limicola]MBV0926049.1 hypothetical protein [Halomicroarcula limicola]